MATRRYHTAVITTLTTLLLLLFTRFAFAEGEAGIISLRGQGHFYVGMEVTEPAENGAVRIKNQMYVGYQLPVEKKHPYPLLLVHGGGGQSSDWFSTPDGRDGWRDYFLAAGFDVYWVDRPGYGRSPANKNYGEMGNGPNSGIISFLANAEHWPGNPADHTDPSILNWLASSPPGPYAGDIIASKAISNALDKIGPAIIVAHSAGAISTWWAMNKNPDQVVGVIAVEPAASNVAGNLRYGLDFVPALPREFEPVKDETGCRLQPEGQFSKLPAYKGKHIYLLGSEMGLVSELPCAIRAFAQAGIEASYVYLPDLGLKGNGHYMMAETNNGDIAQVIMKLAANMEE